MDGLSTVQHPVDLTDRTNSTVLYIRSYLLTRTIVGVLGISLPLILILGEAYFLRGGVQLRGSLSGYYHTSMNDIYVAALCVTGFLLATYLSGQPETPDFWLSLVAGIAVIGVAFFPTTRHGLSRGGPRCGVEPMPDGCSPIQQEFGEVLVGRIHLGFALIFILSLAAIAFIFGYRAQQQSHTGMAALQRLCGWTIILAVVWVVVTTILKIRTTPTPLYLGEVISVWAFGTSWLAKGRSLHAALIPSPRGTMPETPQPRAAVE